MHKLTSSDFSKYGSVIEKNPKINFKNKLYYEVGKDNGAVFWEYEDEVQVEPVEGIGILLINDKEESIRRFILDLPVKMKGLVQFSIISFDSFFSFNLYSKSVRTTIFPDEFVKSRGINSELGISRIYTFLYQNKSKNFAFLGETHPFYELTYVDGGTMKCIIDDEEIFLEQGEILLILPNQMHQMYSASGKGLSFLTVTFDMNFENVHLFSKRILKNDTHTASIIKNLLFELKIKASKRNDMILSLTTQLMVSLIRKMMDKNIIIETLLPLKTGIKNSIVEKCINIIQNNICEKLTIGIIANQLCISPSYLSKIFFQNTNCSIKEYVIKYKIELAKNLIMAGQNNYSEISDKLGYCSAAFFSEQFKKYTGKTPKEYDKSLEKF